MEKILAKRYAFCDFSDIAGFPHPVPTINEWGDYLPRFRGSKYDHPGEHLFNFHECMLEHGFVHEDVLIKLFKFSLEGNAREWCQSLPAVSIHSLKDFHVAFNSYYEKIYSADLLFPKCCHEGEIVPSEKFEDVEGSPYLPDLQFKEDSSQLACLLIEESFQGNIDDYTNDCKAALYPVSDAFDISDLKKELVVKEEDQQVAHFSKQDQAALSSLIFDEYSHEEEQIPFVDLMNNQPVYDSYSQEEDMQRFYDLQLKQQQEVFVFSFIDPFAPCLESLSSIYPRIFLLEGDCLYPLFKRLFCMIWLLLLIKSKSSMLPVDKFLTWLHWKHAFT
jgi:hypothetical protein